MSTIAALLLSRADDEQPALVAADRTWTWREVVAEAAVRASMLADRGHVGVLLENVPEYVFLLGGAALAGTVIVGINPTRRGVELERDVRHTGCSVVITEPRLVPLLDGLDIAPIVVIDTPVYEELVASHRPAAVPTALPDPEDLYLLLFTSGSTGAPKAVRMTQGRAARTASASAQAFTQKDVLYCAMPLFHGNALLTNLFPAAIAGASVVLRRKFSASEFLPDIQRHGCTFFNYVGRALSYIVATPESSGERDNALKWALGSEASPRDIAEFTRRFGCPIYEGYGSSENAVVIQPGPGMPEGAMGRPRAGLDVTIIDRSTGRECPPARFGTGGELLNAAEAIGEIVGRNSASLFEGYYDNPEADAERLRNGWYWSGDLGYRDEDGWIFFAGRTGDWLRVDGENFATAPVERILARAPFVSGIAVYGVADPVTGDQVMCAIEGDFDPVAWTTFLEHQPDLGTKWAPRFVRVVGTVPVTGTGKIDKQSLRADGWECGDAVWVRDGGRYRLLTDADRAELRQLHASHRKR